MKVTKPKLLLKLQIILFNMDAKDSHCLSNGHGWGVHVRKWSYGVDSGRVGLAYLAAWTILTGTRRRGLVETTV